MKRATHFQVKKGWRILLLDMGINPSHALTIAGLPGDLFVRDGAVITPEEYFKFWCGLEELAGGNELPLSVGQVISVETFDPPVFSSLCSPDLNTALQRLSHFKRLIGPLVFDVQITRKKESSNFQKILNDTRKELAQYYLGNSVIPPGEISYLLGYQDSNSFLRAFKSWTGMTPGEYREPPPHGSSMSH